MMWWTWSLYFVSCLYLCLCCIVSVSLPNFRWIKDLYIIGGWWWGARGAPIERILAMSCVRASHQSPRRSFVPATAHATSFCVNQCLVQRIHLARVWSGARLGDKSVAVAYQWGRQGWQNPGSPRVQAPPSSRPHTHTHTRLTAQAKK